MLFTSHFVVGAALGATIQNPYPAFFLGVLSHHLLDALPHFDQGSFHTTRPGPNYLNPATENESILKFPRRDWAILFIDWSIAGIIFTALFLTQNLDNWPAIIAGAIGGLLPDVIDSSPLWSSKLREKIPKIKKFHKFHAFFHWPVPPYQMLFGIITQVIVVVIALYFLF